MPVPTSVDSPLRKIEKAKNKKILVRLKDGEEYIGILSDMDTFMNMVLDDAEEFKDGQRIRKYGKIFIRGNNIIYVIVDYEDFAGKE